jgi:hypothetical protein
MINEALEFMEEAATAAEMIVDHLQDDAQKKLENINGLITGIFGPKTDQTQGQASQPSQKSYRPLDRSQPADTLGQGIVLPSPVDS